MNNEFTTNAEYSVILRERFKNAQIAAAQRGARLSILQMSKETNIVYSQLYNWLKNKCRMSDDRILAVAAFLEYKDQAEKGNEEK